MEIIGTFYFKKTSNGNLIGEYTNNTMDSPCVECAQLILEKTNGFEGAYRTTWIEKDKSFLTFLDITLQGNSKYKYKLIWKSFSNTILFEGVGFVVDHILVGTYTD